MLTSIITAFTHYGKEMHLNKAQTHMQVHSTVESSFITSRGKKYRVLIEAWEEIRLRQKKQIPLHEHPFRLIKITVVNPADGTLIFTRPLWLSVFGKRKCELSLVEIYDNYRRRYDIEHFFRFGKQKLLMDKYQTPDTHHEENWWKLTMLAYVQLFMAREIAAKQSNPWEKYLPQKQNNERLCSPSEVQKCFRKLITEFGTPAKPPKSRGRSLGRKKGLCQEKRKRLPVIKKIKNTG